MIYDMYIKSISTGADFWLSTGGQWRGLNPKVHRFQPSSYLKWFLHSYNYSKWLLDVCWMIVQTFQTKPAKLHLNTFWNNFETRHQSHFHQEPRDDAELSAALQVDEQSAASNLSEWNIVLSPENRPQLRIASNESWTVMLFWGIEFRKEWAGQ